MRDDAISYLIGFLAVSAVAAVTSVWLPVLGLASSALVFLLPVLLVAARGNVGPAMVTAACGALAYNFFLVPPRYTFRVHSLDNLVSVFVLFAVALVTSRLATALKIREAEAEARAAASAQSAQFSALLGRGEAREAIEAALRWLAAEYGEARIMPSEPLPGEGDGFSTLDLSAAAWAGHNGDCTGHGTAVMPASDWTFLPLSPRRQSPSGIFAVARPADGSTRLEDELAQLRELARLLGQARDRLSLEQERQARERLEGRDALRRALLASIAHDFRTPLTVVIGELAELAGNGVEAPGALAEARRLDRMMDDLIGAARLDSGPLLPNLEAVDLVDVVTDAIVFLGSVPAQIRLEQAISADLPLVKADPVLLRHVLINLVDNAIRHARANVSIGAATEAGVVILTVVDDGPGIADADKTHVFERFTRIEGNDRCGGSGLGLAIVKGFADAMDMTVNIGTAAIGGALFRVSIPVHAVSLS